MRCPSCGKTILGNSIFCSYCGMPIRDDYKTRQQIMQNKKEEKRIRSQAAVDAMWSEVEPAKKIQKPVTQSKVSYGIRNGKREGKLSGRRADKMSVLLICPKCHTKYNMFVDKGIYLSLKTSCPVCNKKWRKRYWGTTLITLVLLFLLFISMFRYFINVALLSDWLKSIFGAIAHELSLWHFG